MAVSGDAFRDVLSHWATGVTVVTTCHDGEIHGMTVNSFSSLTVEPPLVLFCADHSAHTYGLVEASGVFAVNVLSADQEEPFQPVRRPLPGARRGPLCRRSLSAGCDWRAYSGRQSGVPRLSRGRAASAGYAYHLRRCSRGGGVAAARGTTPPLLPSPLSAVSRSSVVIGSIWCRVYTRSDRRAARD